jgi:hypothetical protein
MHNDGDSVHSASIPVPKLHLHMGVLQLFHDVMEEVVVAVNQDGYRHPIEPELLLQEPDPLPVKE